jgi:GDP-4-dehydro-6-deoxy-D-mannose reductase
MEKYLITGFSGFVCRHFLEYLEKNEKKSYILGLDIRDHEYKFESFRFLTFEFLKVDLLDRIKVEDVLTKYKPDYLLHLASFSSVAYSWKEPVFSFQNNTNIFLNLLDAIRKLGLSTRILSIGSSEEYGNVDIKDLPLKESHPLNPISPYSVARVSQEMLSRVYSKSYGLDIIMTRSFNHIGPYQTDAFAVPSIIKQLVLIKEKGLKGELLTGDLEIVRDFTDVRDIVSAYYLLLTRAESGSIYNVCSGKGISLKQIAEKLCEILDVDITFKTDNSLIRPNDLKIIIGLNKKLCSDHKWEPVYSIERSLNDIIDYFKSAYRGNKF